MRSSRSYCSRRRERAVDETDRQAQRLELIDLVFHQRDQRRNDQRQAVERHGRQLVAEALSAAGRHDAEAVLPARTVEITCSCPARNEPSPNRDRYDCGGGGLDMMRTLPIPHYKGLCRSANKRNTWWRSSDDVAKCRTRLAGATYHGGSVHRFRAVNSRHCDSVCATSTGRPEHSCQRGGVRRQCRSV